MVATIENTVWYVNKKGGQKSKWVVDRLNVLNYFLLIQAHWRIACFLNSVNDCTKYLSFERACLELKFLCKNDDNNNELIRFRVIAFDLHMALIPAKADSEHMQICTDTDNHYYSCYM